MMYYIKSVKTLQRRCENSVMPQTMLKPQQQKGEKQQTIIEITDAEWHTLINKLNNLAGDLSKTEDKEKYQKEIKNIT